jgi:ornithine carbamoyltransferase
MVDGKSAPSHFLSLADLPPGRLAGVLALARRLKDPAELSRQHGLLAGKVLAMVFAKPSLRTRVSFDVAMLQLGGHALYLSPAEIGLGQRESVADVARVLSRYVDGLMARVFEHADVVGLAEWSSVPVINGLSDATHPCQGLADFLTIWEQMGRLEGIRLTYVGDGNNVAHSLLLGGGQLGMRVVVVHPEGFAPADWAMTRARQLAARAGGQVEATTDLSAVESSDVLYTDVWTSMGQEAETRLRKELFAPYQVNQDLLRRSGAAIVMHCLPAHRGEEITDDVIDGQASRVWDQAENRLHAERGLLAWLMGGLEPAG